MKKIFAILSLFIAFILAIAYIKFDMLAVNKNYGDAGLGEGTVVYTAQKSGFPIHVMDMATLPKLEEGLAANAKDKKLILWLGNSQLHGVNQYKEGQHNSLEFLHDSLAKQGWYTVGFSIANANLQEHYVLLKYLTSRHNISELIIPVFFDDTRETGLRGDLIRDEIRNVICDSTDTTLTGLANLEAFKKVKPEENGDADMKALNATTQEKVEKYLNNKMNGVSTVWDSRAYLRSMIIYDYLFKFRNTVFNISPSTKRKLIPLRYNLNMDAFQAICRLCKEKGIKLLVYIPPIRNDSEQPYILEEYNSFKNEILVYKEKFDFDLINCENVVPAKYWGLKKSTSIGETNLELDFMHFQDTGHLLLADTLYSNIKSDIH